MNKTANKILSISNLTVHYGDLEAVKSFNISIEARERFCLVGESGSGKTTVALSIVKLLPESANVKGDVWVNDKHIYTLNKIQLMELRKKNISIIFQDAIGSLIPGTSIRKQLFRVIKYRLGVSGEDEIRSQAIEFLIRVGLTDYERILASYPSQLSGGMCQRIMIAMALCVKPSLVIADEPTSSVDVLTQQKILELLINLQNEYNFALMFITHDMRIAAHYSDFIGVMQNGRLIEENRSKNFFNNPQQLYSQQLVESAKLLSI